MTKLDKRMFIRNLKKMLSHVNRYIHLKDRTK